MAIKTALSVNEATKRWTKQPTAGIKSQYNETPFLFCKLESAPPNAMAKLFNKKYQHFSKEVFPILWKHGFQYFNVRKYQAVRDQVGGSDIKNKRVKKRTWRIKEWKFISKNRTWIRIRQHKVDNKQ